MKLIAEEASSIQIAAGQIAATTLLHANGVTTDQVAWAWSVYECWLDGYSGSSGIPPEEGAEIRELWGQAQTLAIATACPHLAGAPSSMGFISCFGTTRPQGLSTDGQDSSLTKSRRFEVAMRHSESGVIDRLSDALHLWKPVAP